MVEKIGYTLQEASTFVGVTVRTLRDWITQKKIPAVKIGKKWFVTKDTIDKVLSGNVESLRGM